MKSRKMTKMLNCFKYYNKNFKYQLNQQVTNIFGKFDKIINQEKEKRNDDEVLYTSGGKGIHFNPKMSQDEQEVFLTKIFPKCIFFRNYLEKYGRI